MNKKNLKHILSIMVDNEPGVLARVVGLFSGRGYNIESLSVSEVDSHKFLSRITVVTSGTKIIVDQIKAQLAKLIPVHNLVDITELKSFIGKELILIKLDVKNKQTIDFKKKLERLGAKILEENDLDLIVQFTGSPDEVRKIENIVKPYKIIEQTRSGLVSMATGTDYIKKIER
jgi:acetolactate synthase-1/3 small subunit